MLRLLVVLSVVLVALVTPPGAPAQQQPSWTRADAEELDSFAARVGDDGLDPADYDIEQLQLALASPDVAARDSAATDTFLRLARDLGQGRVDPRDRIAWHIAGPALSDDDSRALLSDALHTHRIAETLIGLLPRHPEYQALKNALAATPASDEETIERLRVNLERWRWMPRDLPWRYILVNVPAFELSLVENGEVVAQHKIIVGQVKTPTPQFESTITGVVFNPWWDVPQSIVAESIGKFIRSNPAGARARGYIVSRKPDGRLRVRQSPGPDNSLGQMKLVMPNPFSAYIHDTPFKQLFDEEVRAFSHGCIRAQDALPLAATLLDGMAGWDKAAIDHVVESRKTTRVDLDRQIPIYVGYFTAAPDAEGRVVSYPDIYKRDPPVAIALGAGAT